MSDYKALCQNVIDKDLCMNCGTCIGICPKEVLSWDGKVRITNPEKCIQCGLCMKSCPGIGFDFSANSKDNYFDGQTKMSNWVGEYKGIYNAKSTCTDISSRSASGGIATHIAVYLLDKNLIQGVVTVKNRKEVPYEFETIIAKSKEELLNSTGSKYCIIPHNEIISQIKQFNGKVLFIGLPCHIHGLIKAMELDKSLADKIYLKIGIFCGFNMSDGAKRYLIKNSRIPLNEVKEFSYRVKKAGKTGALIRGGKGKDFFVEKHAYTFMNLFFVPKRCTMCYDYAAEMADISLGDAWEEKNSSRVIIRTNKGAELFQNLVKEKIISAHPSSEQNILKTQEKVLRYKKIGIWSRLKKQRYIPQYNVVKTNISKEDERKQFKLNFILRITQSKLGRTLLKIIPFSVLTAISAKLKGKEINE